MPTYIIHCLILFLKMFTGLSATSIHELALYEYWSSIYRNLKRKRIIVRIFYDLKLIKHCADTQLYNVSTLHTYIVK